MKPAAPHVIASWMMRGSSSADTTTMGSLGCSVQLDEPFEPARARHRQVEQHDVECPLRGNRRLRLGDAGRLDDLAVRMGRLDRELQRLQK
jgi:hypothetical protein